MHSKICVDTFVVPGDILSLLYIKSNCYINYCNIKLTQKQTLLISHLAPKL